MSAGSASAARPHQPGGWQAMVLPAAILAVQLVATAFFVVDSIAERLDRPAGLAGADFAMECIVALALLGGIVVSFRHIIRQRRELWWQGQSLARATGALAAHIELRFRAWGLTPSESDVALFALKGFDIAAIAGLRGSSPGTIRSELSQIYRKAGVSGHAELIALFIDDLLDVNPAQAGE